MPTRVGVGRGTNHTVDPRGWVALRRVIELVNSVVVEAGKGLELGLGEALQVAFREHPAEHKHSGVVEAFEICAASRSAAECESSGNLQLD